MPHEESLYPADWLRVAEKDLARVELLLSAGDAEAAGFFLQQSVEKYLKAFLLHHGWELRRIHDLEALLNAALAHDSSLEPFRFVCQKVTTFYLVERYPFVTETHAMEKDVRDSLSQVMGLIRKIRAAICPP